ncbi:MAG: ATP-binding cassette domain-containing protein, partial [Chloroflexi bacterium]|nr:ATP-binding cassette domain-containing protein [Chloroflexota bacterium]
MKEVLTARNVWKVYNAASKKPLVAIQDLNLSVGENEFVSITGPSGCGKSTFLLMAAGLESSSAGDIFFEGKPLEDGAPGARLGMVFQNYTLYPWMTVSGNIGFALQKSNLSASEKKSTVE